MATFISLIKFTEQGARSVKESPTRLDNAKKAWAAAGGSITSVYLTLGQYDLIVVSELPDDAAAAKLALQTGALGNITTETLRAFNEDEYLKAHRFDLTRLRQACEPRRSAVARSTTGSGWLGNSRRPNSIGRTVVL